MADIITVTSTLPAKADGGYPIALYETHPEHPNGEAYVAGPKEVQVARTPAVHRLISEGTLEVVEKPGAAEPRHASLPPADGPSNGGGTPAVTQAQRAALASAGFETAEQIRAATDEQLLAVDGIGPGTLARLRELPKE